MNRRAEGLIRYSIASLCALAVSPIMAPDTCFSSPSFISIAFNDVFSTFAAHLHGFRDDDVACVVSRLPLRFAWKHLIGHH